jgi:transposase InsO family protein
MITTDICGCLCYVVRINQ